MTPLFKKRPTIVFVCSANVTRSPYLAHRFQNELQTLNIPSKKLPKVESAGVIATPGMNAHPVLISVLMSRGDSLAFHTSQPFDEEVANRASLVLTAETRHVDMIVQQFPKLTENVFPLLAFGRDDGWSGEKNITDPTGGDVEEYQKFLDLADAQAQRLRRLYSKGLMDPYLGV
jgi:protein-tyrosine-phosphatase